MVIPLFRKIVLAKVYTCVCKGNQISKKKTNKNLSLFEHDTAIHHWFETAGYESSDTEAASVNCLQLQASSFSKE